MKLLVTGGCGFIGSRLCVLAHALGLEVHAADNLRRMGSELNSKQLHKRGIRVHVTDMRSSDAVDSLPKVDVMILAAAEPSVMAGVGASPEYTIGSNLVGTLNCLEKARRDNSAVMLLSTSRVYSIEALRRIAYSSSATRFVWDGEDKLEGFDPKNGIAEAFSTCGFRSIYGSTKLASELMVTEYHYNYSIPTMVLRSGLVAGPGQLARSDQGVIALWVARHCFGQALHYNGFDGCGRQVRDVLHVDDLCELILSRLKLSSSWTAEIYNVGGGAAQSVSLQELTMLCQEVTGHRVTIASRPQTSTVDIPIYITDSSKIRRCLGWQPTRRVKTVVHDIYEWINQGDETLHKVLGK